MHVRGEEPHQMSAEVPGTREYCPCLKSWRAERDDGSHACAASGAPEVDENDAMQPRAAKARAPFMACRGWIACRGWMRDCCDRRSVMLSPR